MAKNSPLSANEKGAMSIIKLLVMSDPNYFVRNPDLFAAMELLGMKKVSGNEAQQPTEAAPQPVAAAAPAQPATTTAAAPAPKMRPLKSTPPKPKEVPTIGQKAVGEVVRDLDKGFTHLKLIGFVDKNDLITMVESNRFVDVFFHVNDRGTVPEAYIVKGATFKFTVNAGREEGQVRAGDVEQVELGEEVEEADEPAEPAETAKPAAAPAPTPEAGQAKPISSFKELKKLLPENDDDGSVSEEVAAN